MNRWRTDKGKLALKGDLGAEGPEIPDFKWKSGTYVEIQDLIWKFGSDMGIPNLEWTFCKLPKFLPVHLWEFRFWIIQIFRILTDLPSKLLISLLYVFHPWRWLSFWSSLFYQSGLGRNFVTNQSQARIYVKSVSTNHRA